MGIYDYCCTRVASKLRILVSYSPPTDLARRKTLIVVLKLSRSMAGNQKREACVLFVSHWIVPAQKTAISRSTVHANRLDPALIVLACSFLTAAPR